MKLELKHITPYLPYELKILNTHRGFVLNLKGIQTDLDIIHNHGKTPIKFIKPILRPLSDLTKEIEYNGEKITPIEWVEDKLYTTDSVLQLNRIIEDERWVNHCDYFLINYLFEWHFDVFGLIEKGLAIDVNTLKD